MSNVRPLKTHLHAMAITWTQVDSAIVNNEGVVLPLYPHEFWYLAPCRTTYSLSDGPVSPLEFGLLLHNAIIGEGLVVSMEVLLQGLPPATEKKGAGQLAELLLESVRAAEFPTLPSRMSCHYLNYDKATAEHRRDSMFRKPRLLTRCHIAGAGKVHWANVQLYESLEGRPDDEQLARQYWQTFSPTTPEDVQHLEVLANTALYFPDWKSFPKVSNESLIQWQASRGVA
jgi:hypothetical protein